MIDLNTRLNIGLLNGDYLETALVPLPVSVWLMLSGLGGLGALKRRRSR